MGDTFGLSGGAEALGNIAAAGINSAAVASTNDTNLKIANNANALSEKLSNTSYQRATADMKAAGLNPMLAYSQGGASTPSIQAPTMEAPQWGDMAKAVGHSAKDALETKNLLTTQQKQIEALQKQIDVKESEKNINDHTAKQIDLKNQIAEAELPAIRKHARIDAKMADADAVAKRIPVLGGVSSAVQYAKDTLAEPVAKAVSQKDEDYKFVPMNEKIEKAREKLREKRGYKGNKDGFYKNGKFYEHIKSTR